ncbi:rCG41927, partial [Rattus norvegicus]
MAECCV